MTRPHDVVSSNGLQPLRATCYIQSFVVVVVVVFVRRWWLWLISLFSEFWKPLARESRLLSVPEEEDEGFLSPEYIGEHRLKVKLNKGGGVGVGGGRGRYR